jgi:hypothetical protein
MRKDNTLHIEAGGAPWNEMILGSQSFAKLFLEGREILCFGLLPRTHSRSW